MPTRRQLIQKIQLNASSSSVTFSNIPQIYTDLKVVFSGRTDYSGGTNGGITDLILRFNNDSSSNYTYRVIYGQTSTAGSFSGTTTSAHFGNAPTANSTASTYSNNELIVPNYRSSINKGFIATTSRENNSTFGDIRSVAGIWSSTSAITRLDIIADYPGGSLVAGTTAYLYGITHVPIINGGEVSIRDGYKYHTFRSASTLQVVEPGDVEYLIVGGGGSGGGYIGGGGGAGGLLTGRTRLTSQTYQVTVGAGAASAAGDATYGNNGSNSTFNAITATGGGAGGSYSISNNRPGLTGGSGGGGGAAQSENFTIAGGSGTSGQGNAGGTGNRGTSSRYIGGGGGGAGAVGGAANPSTGVAGSGGNGVQWPTSGPYYSGGGGGSSASTSNTTPGNGGLGGGGTGISYDNNVRAGDGAANTGGGGAGAGNTTAGSGNGGSGIVIIRYPYDGN